MSHWIHAGVTQEKGRPDLQGLDLSQRIGRSRNEGAKCGTQEGQLAFQHVGCAEPSGHPHGDAKPAGSTRPQEGQVQVRVFLPWRQKSHFKSGH